LLDRDLKLEQARWTSEHELAQRRLRQAAAAQDRAGMAMASAQVDQAQSQLTLVEDKLARATVHAPFDGVIVQGDLSQSLGSPVEQGKVLFEVAPLGEYRVILNVDERDIDQVAAGQTGELVLAGLPRERLAFKVVTVTPISVAQDGRNVFRVEARLDQASPRLRPGMEGVGKVMVTERSLIWIWTHGFTDWLRLSLWRWLP
jgi:multidrug resistance efflux pump